MTEGSDTTLRASQLVERLVIDLNTAEEVGHVAQVLVDVHQHQVEGLVCRTGLLGRERSPLSWVQIESIGKDSLVARLDQGTVSQRLDEAQMMGGLEVWSDAGDRIGRLMDYCIDRQTGQIQRYLYAPEGLRGLADGLYSISPTAVVSAGRKRMMVHESAIAAPELYEAGWTQRATQAQEFLQGDYAQTRQDWEAARQSGQAIAEDVQERAQKFATQAKGQFDQVFGQFQKRTRKLRGQLRETVTDLTASLPTERHRQDTPPPTIDVDSMEVWGEDGGEETGGRGDAETR